MPSENCTRICVWSGPRNVSTTLMYSFAQRTDTLAVDEPLYGHYLRVSGAEHPGADEVMVSSQIFDHAARLRSYALVAEVMGHAVPAPG